MNQFYKNKLKIAESLQKCQSIQNQPNQMTEKQPINKTKFI